MKYYNRWTKERKRELKEDYKNIQDLDVIAEKYHLKKTSLKTMLVQIHAKRQRYFCGQWTDEQIKMLKKEYPKSNDLVDLANRLGKSFCAMRSKAQALGIRRKVLDVKENILYGKGIKFFQW